MFLFNIIKKNICFFARYNSGKEERNIQVFKSNDLIKWDQGTICHINTFATRHNYYMNKIIEIPNHKLFLAIMPFSDMLSKKAKSPGIKALLSYDAINWFDYGLILKSEGVLKT